MGLIKLLKNLYNDLMGACPNCHTFFERYKYFHDPYFLSLDLDDNISFETRTPYELRCLKCNFPYSTGEDSDITEILCFDNEDLEQKVCKRIEYFRGKEYIGKRTI